MGLRSWASAAYQEDRERLASVKDPNQVGALLRAIDGYDGRLVTKFALRFAPRVFVRPGERSADRPMSNNTLNAVLRRPGYGPDDMTAHGFRSMASTLLNELGWSGDTIERQLAHAERDGVRAVYNYAQYLPERRRMMQAWSDYLEHLRSTRYPSSSLREANSLADRYTGSWRCVTWLGPLRMTLTYPGAAEDNLHCRQRAS